MKMIQVESYEKLSRLAADIIGAQVLLKPSCVLGLATGSSPLGTYENLAARCREGLLDFSQVRTVNLDEYCGLTPDNPQSYRYFMDQNLFSKVNVDPANTHLPNGAAPDMEAECERYEALVEGLGWPDLQLLGIGHNGHIGFNEPAEDFPTRVHTVRLAESTIRANSRLFDRPEDVPTMAVTMGIGAIMKARRVLLIAGADKAEIVEKAFHGPVTPQVPASILQLHRDATVILSRS
ncbi:glucosamine-6-phosphate deaminase [Acutalibacter sp. 1XD8-33]|uniref:glucosamine-6-phosphate deaminase n=1 Tax=Acutalibacter sp. 1XD8-33 TaxID=2320081 RepID=UPI000EA16AB6|nr:glucosamine-6-phosphate deaminase [Acutalibacter sp. 1XD8-33]RKJ40778.1 glucosamine-6-phosphate deaminase [Acutalibacter sp. 1XD8-33]